MEKESLMKNIKAGNKEAFRQFYELYAPSAIRTATAITRNSELAKDAVQETFIRVYRYIDRYDPRLPFDPWFYKILSNECLRLMKKEARQQHHEQTEVDNGNGLTIPPFDRLTELYNMIQQLDDIYRIPLVLKYIKGLTEKEIAHILSLNHNTVKSRLFKGRKRIKEQFHNLGKEDVPNE